MWLCTRARAACINAARVLAPKSIGRHHVAAVVQHACALLLTIVWCYIALLHRTVRCTYPKGTRVGSESRTTSALAAQQARAKQGACIYGGDRRRACSNIRLSGFHIGFSHRAAKDGREASGPNCKWFLSCISILCTLYAKLKLKLNPLTRAMDWTVTRMGGESGTITVQCCCCDVLYATAAMHLAYPLFTRAQQHHLHYRNTPSELALLFLCKTPAVHIC